LNKVKNIVFIFLCFLLFIINCSEKPKNINVILISIDTLRPDHLSCYGYKRNTTPFLDKIAKDGIIFKNVISSSSWTAPAMASLFTSLNSSTHKILRGTFRDGNVYNQEVLQNSLNTIPMILKKNGFFTMGFANNLILSKKSGFAKGFDVFVYTRYFNSKKLNETIMNFKNKYLKKDKNFFLWIHYFDPHWPYSAHSPWIEKYASKKNFEYIDFKTKSTAFLNKYKLDKNNKELLDNLIDRYDSEINFLDENIKNLFKALPVEDNNLVIVTADHGEEFLEHNGFNHGNNLYNQTIRIPLIIKLPAYMNIKKISIDEDVGIIDIFPTILDILNIPEDSKFEGKSFLSLMKNGKISGNRVIISELYRNNKKIISSTQGRWKYIHYYKTKKTELFDLKNDKYEIENLVDKNPAISSYLENKINKSLESSKGKKTKTKLVAPDKNTVKALKSLGYIE